MYSFWLVTFASCEGPRVRLKFFKIRAPSLGEAGGRASRETNYWRLAVEKTRTPLSFNHLIMRTKLLAGFVLLTAFAGGASAAVVMEKRSRQVPHVEVFGCQGVHSFVFRGPTGTSRRPILVPPREYWTAREAGIYSFVVRYSSGQVCSRLVTPEVFARYQVGEHFYDRPAVRDYSSDDSKTSATVFRHRHTIAQAWPGSEKSKPRRAVAKHRKNQRSKSSGITQR